MKSTSVFDSAGDVASATLNASGYSHPGELQNWYLSANDGTNWEAVTLDVEHSFTNPGKHIRWMVNFTNITNDWLNKTTYVTDVEVSTEQSNPSNITLDFGGDGLTNYTISGVLNSTNGSIEVDLSDHNLSNALMRKR